MTFVKLTKDNKSLKEKALEELLKVNNTDFFSDDELTLNYLLLNGDEIIGGVDYKHTYTESDLLFIYIKKEYRGNNYSKYLLDESFKELKKIGIKKVFLEVDTENHIAYNLYKSYGFKEISIRKNYYSNSHDAIIMEKEV